jgi:UDP-2,3-diacylglucosamine hydrolase
LGKIYFASDFHLGIDTKYTSLEREKHIVRWLKEISPTADEIYLLGDVFDFWFEYKTVVPKGYMRLLGQLAQCVDSGITIHWITGNHDMWTFGYLEKEIGVLIHKKPIVHILFGKKVFMAHGDGFDDKDYSYKLLKKILSNSFCQRLFSIISPRVGLYLMRLSSHSSRRHQNGQEENTSDLIDFCNDYPDKDGCDYFLFGHKHCPQELLLNNGRSKYINLGDWTSEFTYAIMDEEGSIELKSYPILS